MFRLGVSALLAPPALNVHLCVLFSLGLDHIRVDLLLLEFGDVVYELLAVFYGVARLGQHLLLLVHVLLCLQEVPQVIQGVTRDFLSRMGRVLFMRGSVGSLGHLLDACDLQLRAVVSSSVDGEGLQDRLEGVAALHRGRTVVQAWQFRGRGRDLAGCIGCVDVTSTV